MYKPESEIHVLRCPECSEAFFDLEEVYRHSAIFHYGTHFSDLYATDYLLKDGVCCICTEREVNPRTFICYVEHIGGHHKLIHQFMTLDILALYLRLPASTQASKSCYTASIKEEISVKENQNVNLPVLPVILDNSGISCVGTATSNQQMDAHFLNEMGGHQSRALLETSIPQADYLEPQSHLDIFMSQEQVYYEAEKVIGEAANVKLQVKDSLGLQQPNQDQTVMKASLSGTKPSGCTNTRRHKKVAKKSINKYDNHPKNRLREQFKIELDKELYGEIDQAINEAIQFNSKIQSNEEKSNNLTQFKANGIVRKTGLQGPKCRRTKLRSKMHAKHHVKLGRKIVNRKQDISKVGKYQCPECSYKSNHVSPIYTHSAYKHYFNQLADLYKSQFMMTSSKVCIQCPERPVETLTKYVLHLGGKHKMIHKFIPKMFVELYEKFPSKKLNLGYNQSKLHSSLKCLVCKSGTAKHFANITEYKQHLATHYRQLIVQDYKNKYPSQFSEFVCQLCSSIQGLLNKPFKNQWGLILHLGSKHNQFLDFASNDVLEQLKCYNLTKC